MEPKTLFAIARPYGCFGGEETIEECLLQFTKDSAIAIGAAEKLNTYADGSYEVFEVEIVVKRKIA